MKLGSVPSMARKVNGAAVKALRSALGISQRSLAARAGIDASSLSGAEIGKHGLSPTVVRRIADALGCPVDAITSVEPEPEGVAS